jgi:formylglycine-generating enzyme required for sulfatase activity
MMGRMSHDSEDARGVRSFVLLLIAISLLPGVAWFVIPEVQRRWGEREPAKYITNSIGMKLVYIAPGEFEMGSPEGEEGRETNETLHRVKITKGYYLGEAEVTQRQWQRVMGTEPSHFKGDDLPVEMVRWEDAVAFCEKLGKREGRRYRLPTEAEWEYACRAGTKTRFCSGDGEEDLARVGWYDGNSREKNKRTTHPVKSKEPNGWSLYDMHGNVREWCADWYTVDLGSAEAVDPAGPAEPVKFGATRVVRGGGWRRTPGFCRSACRYGYGPVNGTDTVGFRVAVDLK